MQNHQAMVDALCAVTVAAVIPRIPLADLQQMWQGACVFVNAAAVEAEFLALVDMFDRPLPAQRRERQARFRAEIDLARQQTPVFRLDALVRTGLALSRARLADLQAGRVPVPGFPPVEEG
jgi:hypothetical protein